MVPETETTTGIHLWLLTVGGIIGIPAFIMLARIGGDIGLRVVTFW
ncbi:hypothetical protein [Emcibacter nanhaiensis]|nr:hypothetical protein [Emcibacter nanhaiensis]